METFQVIIILIISYNSKDVCDYGNEEQSLQHIIIMEGPGEKI